MLKKCATSVLHFNKKNLILGHIPYLYLRKNIFYCRIKTHKVNPELTEKVMPIVVAVMSNSNYQGNYAKSLLSDIIYSTLTNSPDKLEECWQAMQTVGNFKGLCRTIKHSTDENFLRVVLSKKEDAYATKAIEFKNVKRIERALAKRKYIKRKLNAEYPNLPIEQQLIQAAYDIINSGDEQKKKEFNEFLLAEGEPRLSKLDAKVMDYLHENCTQNNLDKVNALRSFYGLKVELKTGNTVDIDERTAVRKVFDRTWSSYERGTNRETKEPYYTEADMEKARIEAKEKGEEDPVKNNQYYENSVSPAYRKYFEEHDIYEIYHTEKSDEDKKYSAQDYRDLMIDKSPFRALRKHGLYNDAKIICDTLEALQVEPEIAVQFNLKDLSDMVVNSHNNLEDRKVYTQDTEEYMFTKSPHTDELNGNWRAPYYWYQHDDDEDEDWYDEDDNEDYDENDDSKNDEIEDSADGKQYDEEGFEIIPVSDNYSEANEEPAARDTHWQNLVDHNHKVSAFIEDVFARHDITDDASSGFLEAASYGTPGVGSRRENRKVSATDHHDNPIQYGGTDSYKNLVPTPRYFNHYGSTFEKDKLYLDPHKSFHRRDTPFDALYINPNAKSSDDKLATVNKTNEDAQKAFLTTSFIEPNMAFYGGFRKIDQYTGRLYKMRDIEKEKQERVDKTEKSLEYLTKLGNALSCISICISEALKTEEKIITGTENITQKIKASANHNKTSSENVRHSRSAKNGKLNDNQYE